MLYGHLVMAHSNEPFLISKTVQALSTHKLLRNKEVKSDGLHYSGFVQLDNTS